MALVPTAANRRDQTVEPLRARDVPLKPRREHGHQRGERHRDLALVQAELPAKLLSGASALRCENGIENVRGAFLALLRRWPAELED
jgi:hypothetical protein